MIARWAMSWFALASLTAPAVAKQTEPLRLAASSPWWLNYDDDSCTMKRLFGGGADAVGLTMEMFAPGGAFYLSATGKPFKSWTSEEEIGFRFGPVGEDQTARYFSVKTSSRDPGVLFRRAVGIEPATENGDDDRDGGQQPDYAIDEAREQQVSEVFLQRTRRERPIILETQSMGEPLKALRKCGVSLIEGWGLDPAKHMKLSRLAAPLSAPQRWINSDDYPSGQLMMLERAVIHFRLNVDETGQATGCHIQRALGDKQFERTVCANMMANAKFSPALDEHGASIASAYVSTVSFVIGEAPVRKRRSFSPKKPSPAPH